jgi:uncharacterized protein YjiS (DUF1127 family)
MSPMTTLALATLLDTRLLHRLVRAWTEFTSGIQEARAMALLYQTLARLSDRELAVRGLTRQDIPRAVLAAFNGI